MKRRIFAILMILVLFGSLVLSVSADIVMEPEPEEIFEMDPGSSDLLTLILIIGLVLAVSAVALVLILVLVKKRKP